MLDVAQVGGAHTSVSKRWSRPALVAIALVAAASYAGGALGDQASSAGRPSGEQPCIPPFPAAIATYRRPG